LDIDVSAMLGVGRLVLMGGSFDEGGNVTPDAEFNAHADPVALQRVLRAGLRTTVIPLDVTHRVKLMRADLDAATFLDHGLHQFLRDMTDVYMRFHRDESDRFDGSYIHDALTVAAVVRPDLFTFRRGAVRVETAGVRAGRTDWACDGPDDRSGAVHVATAVDARGCLDLFWSALRRVRAAWRDG
jgi:inosine-uridine nucleoside N-ribohydrolase